MWNCVSSNYWIESQKIDLALAKISHHHCSTKSAPSTPMDCHSCLAHAWLHNKVPIHSQMLRLCDWSDDCTFHVANGFWEYDDTLIWHQQDDQSDKDKITNALISMLVLPSSKSVHSVQLDKDHIWDFGLHSVFKYSIRLCGTDGSVEISVQILLNLWESSVLTKDLTFAYRDWNFSGTKWDLIACSICQMHKKIWLSG